MKQHEISIKRLSADTVIWMEKLRQAMLMQKKGRGIVKSGLTTQLGILHPPGWPGLAEHRIAAKPRPQMVWGFCFFMRKGLMSRGFAAIRHNVSRSTYFSPNLL